MPAAKTRLTVSKTGPSPRSKQKLRVSIIGGGRMGSALGRALQRKGHRIELIVTRHRSSAKRAAILVGGSVISLTQTELDRPSDKTLSRLINSHLLLIATPDDVLAEVALRLARVFTARPPKPQAGIHPVALHTSGAVSYNVLAPLRRVGLAVGSLHPLISVADAAAKPGIFRGANFCVEGDREAVLKAKSIAKDLTARTFTIKPNVKPLYHAAAAMASGHVVALFDVALEMLEECGLSRRRAQQILLPLIASTFESLEAKSPAQALTGPLSRGDITTIKKHLAALKPRKFAQAADVYSSLGQRALKLSQKTHSDKARLAAIAKLLSQNRVRSE